MYSAIKMANPNNGGVAIVIFENENIAAKRFDELRKMMPIPTSEMYEDSIASTHVYGNDVLEKESVENLPCRNSDGTAGCYSAKYYSHKLILVQYEDED